MHGHRQMEMVMAADKLYEVLGRYVERPDFRISELRIGPAQEVPWHFHTNVPLKLIVLEVPSVMKLNATAPTWRTRLWPEPPPSPPWRAIERHPCRDKGNSVC
jgi:hypothetical protein